jgi:transcriptional antiterminator NusG
VLGNENENKEVDVVVDSSVEVIEESTERKPLTDVVYPDHKWYVVNAHSGMEYKAKLSLEERVKSLRKESLVSEVIVPEETVVELVRGQKKTTKRKFFPGYILVKMKLTDESWHLIKNTPKISGFVGDKRNPAPVPETEISRMTNRITEGASRPKPKTNFSEGEKVRVVDGPFNNFNGVIEDINTDKGKLRVLVSIFGRSTPVELDFVQVEKV